MMQGKPVYHPLPPSPDGIQYPRNVFTNSLFGANNERELAAANMGWVQRRMRPATLTEIQDAPLSFGLPEKPTKTWTIARVFYTTLAVFFLGWVIFKTVFFVYVWYTSTLDFYGDVGVASHITSVDGACNGFLYSWTNFCSKAHVTAGKFPVIEGFITAIEATLDNTAVYVVTGRIIRQMVSGMEPWLFILIPVLIIVFILLMLSMVGHVYRQLLISTFGLKHFRDTERHWGKAV